MIREILNSLAASPYEQVWFQFSLRCDCGFCPSGCRDGIGGGMGRVYRSSRRSLTMQCPKCGLQWTMTVHRIAQVTARKAETEARPERRLIAQMWAEWATGVKEERGVRSKKGGA
jgi:hypothetical protein